ncbi:MAG TPA: HPr kinase/phosphatase C-terminal domain-containing protein [Pseudorhodoplanes sp.]|nr:HPr kinase/phosphatase C-terminal domain-containing protein [Pseudorhodoplanes sp.]
MSDPATIHASAALVGARAVLVRGASGSGKSSFVLALLRASQSGVLPFARLVADDRAIVTASHDRLIVRPVDTLAGLIEARGLGILRLPYEGAAVIGCVVDLGADSKRLPDDSERETVIAGVRLARLAVAPGADPLLLFRNFLDRTAYKAPQGL